MSIRSKLTALLLAAAVGGCGLVETRTARNPLNSNSLIGLTYPDLLASMGVPDHAAQTGPETAIVEYDRADTSAGLEVTAAVLGSIKIGGGGGCHAVFTILREGTVADVEFPQSYADGIFAAPYSACAPLISEALMHPSSTGLPAGYDAFLYIPKSAAK